MKFLNYITVALITVEFVLLYVRRCCGRAISVLCGKGRMLEMLKVGCLMVLRAKK